jgi:hypothetical protein
VSSVFISYRRDDAAAWAGRLCDHLSSSFGPDRVFMDVEDIPPGSDFTQAIENTVSQCDVLLAVIGPRWLELLREGRSDRDFVVHEIAAALRRGVTVIPVLVGGAVMPAERELPPELAPLGRRQAVTLRDAEFAHNTSELVRVIRRANAGGRSSKKLAWLLVATGVLIAITGSAIFLFNARQRAALDGTWIARMQRPGARPYTIRVEFVTSGSALTGRVQYPTGDAAIEEGRFEDGRLRFLTRHIPQFESEPATLRFTGQVRGREVDLVMTAQDGALTRGTARKTE